MAGIITNNGLYRFFKHFCHWSAVPLLLYILLTIFINMWLFGSFATAICCPHGSASEVDPEVFRWVSGAIITGIFFLFTISPLGEGVIRLKLHASRLKRGEYPEVRDLFEHAYQLALKEAPGLPRNVSLRIIRRNRGINAWACGRKTICVSRGFAEAEMPDEQKIAILLHEFGHLAHHDTIFLQAFVAGELIVSFVIMAVSGICFLAGVIGKCFEPSDSSKQSDLDLAFALCGCAGVILNAIGLLLFNVVLVLWTRVGSAVYALAARADEYRADHFAGIVGYAHPLADSLINLSGDTERETSVFALIAASHPGTNERVSRLRCFPQTCSDEVVFTKSQTAIPTAPAATASAESTEVEIIL